MFVTSATSACARVRVRVSSPSRHACLPIAVTLRVSVALRPPAPAYTEARRCPLRCPCSARWACSLVSRWSAPAGWSWRCSAGRRSSPGSSCRARRWWSGARSAPACPGLSGPEVKGRLRGGDRGSLEGKGLVRSVVMVRAEPASSIERVRVPRMTATTHTHTQMHKIAHAETRTYKHTHVNTRTSIPTCVHTYTHTHTHTSNKVNESKSLKICVDNFVASSILVCRLQPIQSNYQIWSWMGLKTNIAFTNLQKMVSISSQQGWFSQKWKYIILTNHNHTILAYSPRTLYMW